MEVIQYYSVEKRKIIMKYFVVAGEASGDLHASGLIARIREADSGAEFGIIGGELMSKAAGVEPLIRYDELNVMGFSEVLRNARRLLTLLKRARKLMLAYRPDALVLVDYPGFNLKLAKEAHKAGIKTHYFISPKIWAWKEWRIKAIKRNVDHMYSILPFEVDWYKSRHAYDVDYVGNPTVGEMDKVMTHIPPVEHFLSRIGIDTDRRGIIALLPGSRRGEVRNNLPLMIEAAKRFPDFQYIVAAAPSLPLSFYREVAQDPGLKVTFGTTNVLVKESRAALVTSGTATLETALLGVPQVVCYRANGSKISYKIMEKLLNVKYVSLPNLIANDAVVPELLVYKCTADSIAAELEALLSPSPKRDAQLAGYKLIRRRLGGDDATANAAKLIVERSGNTASEA